MGLNARERLPVELGGTSVLFDGKPAPVLFASPEHAVAVAPLDLGSETLVEIHYQRGATNAVLMRVAQNPGLLTAFYSARPPYDTSAAPAPGLAQNEDGTWNGEDNPARAGSRIRVFLTGLRAPDEPEPGSIAAGDAPMGQVWGHWRHAGRTPAAAVRLVPGFLTALRYAEFEAPAPPPGAEAEPLTFQVYGFDPTFATRPAPDSNAIGVWVR